MGKVSVIEAAETKLDCLGCEQGLQGKEEAGTMEAKKRSSKVVGTCANCKRVKLLPAHGLCRVCYNARRAAGKDPEAIEKALAEIRGRKISFGYRKTKPARAAPPTLQEAGLLPGAGQEDPKRKPDAPSSGPPKEEKAQQKAQEAEHSGAGTVAKILEGKAMPTQEKIKGCRVMFWSEINTEEKCRRLRVELKNARNTLEELRRTVALLSSHSHDPQGTVVAPLRGLNRGNVADENMRRGPGTDDCYF